ncbi:MAG: YgzB family protein [Actinobacteria bacterium]|nr:YgzB family protein [Actinomycetota bacterium]MCA1722560.1 YgzB family protein [Actinomycetota bacterium]
MPESQAQITCPSCGAVSSAVMPVDACQHFYRCPDCEVLLRPLEGDCCVFCSFGNSVCPPKAAEAGA